ncbi:geranylgeranylglycerol-phosphate geranylgeranyltransferase [candidate division WOR-3 bacterium]|nr:geranylgeranylglycerol-phosphate geranylgeranyltransferase [candidate division WOR-3 bacterium]
MAYVRVIRPANCAITAVSVLVGALIGRDIILSGNLIAAALIGFGVCAFGNLVNDIKDIEIDRINDPTRPLPSGKVRKNVVWFMAFAFMAGSALASFFLGTIPFLVVIAALILLVFYSVYLKKTMAGNITVALIAGLSFIFGGIVAANPASVIPGVFAVLIHLPREMIKDVIDMSGDRLAGARTLPIVAGPSAAYNLSAVFLGLLCIALPLPYITGILKLTYMVIILCAAYPLLFYIMWRLLKNPSSESLPLLSNLLKAGMAIGLIAMIVS